jgi:flagellar biosynthetic protein FliR
VNLDAAFVFGFCCLFVRCSAMLLASPLTGAVVPVMIRVLTSAVLSLALLPVVKDHLPPVPADLPTLILAVGREALVGLLIGFCLQILTSVFQMAGSLIDLQAGLASAQVFSPMTASASTPFARFKFMLAIVMLFSANAHQLMIKAFVRSYEFSGGVAGGWEASMQQLVTLIGSSLVLALQIAAPAAGVCALIDLAAGLINRAVPQTQPFLLALPAKLALGVGVLAVALPAMTYGVTVGIDRTFDSMFHILKGV